jgi:carboxypeptidase C (cathepsin A)
MISLKMCIGDSLCYVEQDFIASLLNQQATRDLLGIPTTTGNFTSCSDVVSRNFASHLDKWRLPAQFYVTGLLERGVRILLYEGMYFMVVHVASPTE